MQRTLTAFTVLLILSAAASAQAPIWVDLGPGTSADDVTVVNGEVIVVGTDSGAAFRWSSLTGMTGIGSDAGSTGSSVHVSDDGASMLTTNTGMDGIRRASFYAGAGAWTGVPGIGATSGGVETTAAGLSGDGLVSVGLGWATAGTGHAYRATALVAADLTPPFSMPSSRANGVNDDGSVVVGWDQGPRYGARWVNGVRSYFVYTAPSTMQYATGESSAVNGPGTIAVGSKIFTFAPNDGWRWNASTNTITRLANLAGGGVASPTDVSDDGGRIVGHTGGTFPVGTTGVIWINDQPVNLKSHLDALGCVGVAAYSDVGYVAAISGDGGAICGRGTGTGLGQPTGGWVVYFPGGFSVGTSFCAGDGTGAACPCGNSGSAGNGCASSVNTAGARLAATGGFASLSNDVVTLQGTGMPNSSALFFQGTTQQGGGGGSAFGDGKRCAGGSVIRLGTKANSGGASSYPGVGDPSISMRGLVTAPGMRTYQCWYRNAAAFCTPSTFNLTNGVEIDWAM